MSEAKARGTKIRKVIRTTGKTGAHLTGADRKTLWFIEHFASAGLKVTLK